MAATEERSEQSSSDGKNVGRIEEITGVVIEAVFPDELPEINSALHIERPKANLETEGEGISGSDQDNVLVCEVQQHLGDDRVRAVAMDSTDGLTRGTKVVDTGGPVTGARGKGTPGGHFNPPGGPGG